MRYIHIRFAADAEAYYAFLSTPSARRATLEKLKNSPVYIISIHALREEGDEALRPITREQVEFLSTPSARRATQSAREGCKLRPYFYPRPPRGGRRFLGTNGCLNPRISIHALREEGDAGHLHLLQSRGISIHALREEGDSMSAPPPLSVVLISIHALREEGDLAARTLSATSY